MNMKVHLLRLFKEEFRMDIDPWGHTMEWFFTVAHLLHGTYGKTPKHWEYNPGIISRSKCKIDVDEYPLIYIYDLRWIREEDLIFLGNCLFRICRQLRKLGKDY